nr:ribonuclease H-like domain-containing protein [Tanacetum cinerariifolium]
MLKMIADSAGFATVIVVDFAVFLEDNSRLHLMPSSSRRNVVDPRTVGLADTTKEELVIQKEEMELESAQSSTTAKLPLLKQGDYEIWRLRIEQYFQIQDYALWDVIENGNSFKPVAGQQQMMLVPQLQLYPVSLLLKRRLKRRMMSKQEVCF